MLGEGIVFSEGPKWKNKRRLISHAFNFDLLKQNIPKICNICDRKFADLEKGSNIKEGEFSYKLINLGNRMFNGVMMACFFGSD
jgi:cytochrome P450